jgi:hypothetical protein
MSFGSAAGTGGGAMPAFGMSSNLGNNLKKKKKK